MILSLKKLISLLEKVISSLKKHGKSILLRPIFHVKNATLVVFSRVSLGLKKKKGNNPPFDGGYEALNHWAVRFHSRSRGVFFRFRSLEGCC